ncbi:MAG: DUF1648 domain-containing protein [Thermoguttaceae bacterium]
MKTLIAAVVLITLYVIFLACVFSTPAFLPQQFATHFNAAGKADGWMNRSSFMMLEGGMGTFGILVMLVAGSVGRFVPEKYVNLPNRDYWLADERRAETMSYLFRQMLWIASLLMCLLIAVHVSTIHANKTVPPHLHQGEALTILGCFLAATLIWMINLLLHFKRTG